MIASSFWRDAHVFVTGHTGFKGAWLSLMLERLGASVTGYGLAPATEPSLYDLARVGDGLCDVRGDVCDAAFIDGALRAAEPDIVFHLAARVSRGGPALPVEGEANVVEAIETAASVRCALIVAPERRAASRGRLSAKSREGARMLDVFLPDPVGGGDFACVAQGGNALHVLDALYGLLTLAEIACRRKGRIASHWAFAEPGEARALGWSAHLSPEEARALVDDWNGAFAAGENMREKTLAQIDAYLEGRVRNEPVAVRPVFRAVA